MKYYHLVALLGLTILLSLSSCTPIYMGLYGMHELEPQTSKQIVRYAEKYNIPAEASYELDSSYYGYLLGHDTSHALSIKNHYQPLQAMYYDKEGRLTSFHVNCYAGGFPNLNWNRERSFDTFPPSTLAPLDSLVSVETHRLYIDPLGATKHFPEEYDYLVIVHWDRFMGRQSKRLIELVQENAKLGTGEVVKVVYINNDSALFGLMGD